MSLKTVQNESIVYNAIVEYLKEKKPEIADLVLVSSQTQIVSGRDVILICSYKEKNRDFYLKAFISNDEKGTKRVTKILFSYEYNNM